MESGVPQPSWRSSAAALLAGLQQRLVELFEDPHLEQLRDADPTHPAVLRYDAIEQLRRAGELVGPGHEQLLVDALRHWLDTVTWVPVSADEDVWSSVADAATKRRLAVALRDREQFEDTLAELFVLGWLRDAGVQAERTEQEGLSDIAVPVPEGEARVEVKRVHERSGTRRVADVIAKANSQIKASDPPGGGVVYLSLGLPLLPVVAGDELPWEIEMRVEEARRATRRQNSSVSAVVLIWDDFLLEGEDPDPIAVLVRRRSVVVEHAAPLRPASLPHACLDVQISAATAIQFAQGDGVHQTKDGLVAELRATLVAGADLGDRAFTLGPRSDDAVDRALPLRPSHVRQAFAKPHAFAVYEGGNMAVLTRHVVTRERELVLVVCARRNAAHPRWIIEGGYQLFGEPAELRRLAGDPSEAFAEVLIRYGNRFRVGYRYVWWAASLRFQLPVGTDHDAGLHLQLATALGMTSAPERCQMSATAVLDDTYLFTVSGLHWIHLDRYRAAVIEAARTHR